MFPEGSVTGLDANPEMLSVAASVAPEVDWREGAAESLPFPDESFDAVVSQFGLMFFDDRPGALREMERVLRPGGRMAVAVCGALDQSPGYAVLAELLHRLFGAEVAESFRAPFVLGDRERLEALYREAGLAGGRIERREGQVRFDSINALVSTERACVWTLGGLLDESQFQRLDREAAVSFLPYQQSDGGVVFAMPALIITATRR
jgi:SAM-dependent methyltransferase